MKCQKINFSLARNYSTITNIYRFSIFYFAFFSMLDHDVKLVFSVLWLWLKAVESALGQINPYSSTDYRRHAVSHRLLFFPPSLQRLFLRMLQNLKLKALYKIVIQTHHLQWILVANMAEKSHRAFFYYFFKVAFG